MLIVAWIAVPCQAQFELLWGRDDPMGMNNIHGVTVDPENGHLYIVHFANQNIQHFDEELEHVETFNIGVGGIRGMGFDTQENQLIVANGGNIRIVDLNGEVLRTIPNNGGSNTVCYDPDRDLYVVGRWGGQVAYFNRDGEQVGGFNSNISITGICYYPINGSIFIMHGDDPVFEFSIEGEQIGNPLPNDQINENGQDLAYDPRQRILYATGQIAWLGAFEDNYGALGEPQFEPEAFDLQVPFGMVGEEELVITNVGEEGSSLSFEIEDVGEGVDWLECDPVEGELELDESAEIALTIATEELQPGNFERIIIVYTNAPEFREVEIPVTLMVIAGFGELRGTVTDAANDNPIEGAMINVHNFNLDAVSDENGEYVIADVPEWVYTVSITAENYLPQTIDRVEILEDQVTELDFNMLHSVCELSPEDITENIPVNEEIEVAVNIANPGNGPLTWTVDKVFPEGMDAEPWTLRDDVPAGVITEDSRIQGAVFIDDHYYLSAANNRDPMIYVLNRDQELVDQFGQHGEGRYGYKDLAFDGELIWGSGERSVYGFTPEGEEVTSFDSGISPCNNIAWDNDREILWASGTTTEIFGYDREGNQVAEISRHELRVYGLAYWPDDPDGHQLYVFHKINDVGDLMIAKIDIENDAVMDVFILEPEAGGVAQGCFITNQWDYYSWVFMGVANNGAEDRVDIMHLQANTGWVEIDPAEWILEAEDEIELTVSLSTLDFPVNLEFTVDLVFSHDGVGGQTVLPVSLTASGDEGPEMRTIEMNFGWNMVSVNVEPEDNDIIALTQALVDEDLMEMMKNGSGQFYSPAFGFNNIPGWEVTDGYLIKTTAGCELAIEGMPVAADEPIPLAQGWQMKGYFPRVPVEATVALSGIVDNLEMAKDGSGRFYSPAFGFSNMGNMTEGCGYMFKMSEAMDLVYVVEEDQVAQSRIEPEILPILAPTSENMSLLVLSDISPELNEMEIGVFSGDKLVGSGRMNNGACGIAVWGDDPTTELREGATHGDLLELRFISKSADRLENNFSSISGNGIYERDELWVVELGSSASVPEEFGIVSAYPNPFNNATQISFRITESSPIDLAIFDLNGRRVIDLAKGQYEAGIYTLTLVGTDLSSGLYLVNLKSIEGSSKLKLSFIK